MMKTRGEFWLGREDALVRMPRFNAFSGNAITVNLKIFRNHDGIYSLEQDVKYVQN